MSSSCVWAMSYWDAWDEPVTECLDPLNEKGLCPCEPYCEGPDVIPCFRDADEWELVAVPRAAFRGRTWREGSLSWTLHHGPAGWWATHEDGDVITFEDVGACPFCGRELGEVER